jgi:hypothetical protein
MLTGDVPKSIIKNTKSLSSDKKNSKEDIDCEYYSLQYFIKLACEGQTVALDMLHANEENILITSSIWKDLQRRRKEFYTTNLNAFVGYARKQAAKYGIKGSRMETIKRVIDFLNDYSEQPIKLEYIWDLLPYDSEHIHFLDDPKNSLIKLYQVCGKKFQSTVTTEHVRNILKKYYEEYGHRAELAKSNQGIDWKSVSHALRACYQLLEIYETGDLKYPLKEAEFLKGVKLGKYDYKITIGPLLEHMMSEIEWLASNVVDYPNKIDFKYWNNWVYKTLISYYMITERK